MRLVKTSSMRAGLFFVCILALPQAFAQKGTVYISPNNDGVQDALTIPFSIRDKRYVTDWSLVVADEAGKTVRTVGNKENRPDRLTFTGFFKRLFGAKEGVHIPPSVTWNGVLETGETAPDGTYRYYITAADDNGNRAKTEELLVVVDNTPPMVDLVRPSASDLVFGAGNKVMFEIRQSGSIEDRWDAEIRSSDGAVVRRFVWENAAPASFLWDGTDDSGSLVPDGVYSYSIASTDRAGNSSVPTSIDNIIYSGERPVIGIALAGSRYFSPNGDGVRDTVELNLSIPRPTAGNTLSNWQLEITDEAGRVRRTYGGGNTVRNQILFDGRDDAGTLLEEGSYRARLSAAYRNGYEPVPVRSPSFVLDNTAPAASLKTASSIFSPDGDGRMDIMTITQTVSKDADWLGEILDAEVRTVRSFAFGSRPSDSVDWDGLTDDGDTAPDGMYTYRLSASDAAGNTGSSTSTPFELNMGATEVVLTALSQAFSPNGDGIKDTVAFRATVKSPGGIASYRFTITDESGRAVKTIEAESTIPDRFTWDGKDDAGNLCADGNYAAALETVSKNGSQAKSSSRSVLLDTVFPRAAMSTEDNILSPNGDGNKDELAFVIDSSEEAGWSLDIFDANDRTMRRYNWAGRAESFAWDGADDSGNIVSDGMYYAVLSSEDSAGNRFSTRLDNISVDARMGRAFFTTAERAISPNGDGIRDEQRFNFTVEPADGLESWNFAVKTEAGTVVREWGEGDQVPPSIVWDGRDAEGNPVESALVSELSLVYKNGSRVSASGTRFISTVRPPVLNAATSPRYFSPDNDGVDDDLIITLSAQSLAPLKEWSFEIRDPENGSVFWHTEGTSSITERMVWDGRGSNGELVQSAMDYPYTFRVTDELGMSSSVDGIIAVDVLVIRVGDVLKMQVPAIIFRADNADFKSIEEEPTNGLTQAQIDNNIRVLRRIAEILNKFKDYSVRIEGHANNISGTEAEETSTANGNIPLIPLSEARAETVRRMLISFGVNGSRLSIIGVGGRQPVVPREDRANWWKNRRVEFILEK